jgi:Phospholipase_D-nuclease N-terminal
MILFEGVFGVIAFAVWIFCIIDVITTPAAQVRNLPKLLWLVVVVLLVDVGSIAWLIAGRPWAQRPLTAPGRRPGTPARTPARPSNPDDDEDFLAGLRLRAEEQRRRARESNDSQGDEAGGTAPA